MDKLPKVMTVMVNKTNIRRGLQGDSECCAISKAVQRQIQAKRKNLIVETGAGEIWINDGDEGVYVGATQRIQKQIRNFISKFDRDKNSVKPCAFRVRLRKKSEQESFSL